MSSFNYKKAESLNSCQWKDCYDSGYHKAPKNVNLSEYFFFCLKHVRQYNLEWGYERGSNPLDMENEYQNIATWERPTWKINGTKKYLDTWNSVEDQFEIRKENLKTEELIKLAKMSEDEKKARLVLGVGSSISLSSLKKHYHKLVKKHHPDTNPHEGGTHNKIKSINNAYTSLKKIIISQ